MAKFHLKKWRHPKDESLRVYINGLETTDKKVWFERGERKDVTLPPIYDMTMHTEGQLTKELSEEVAEAFSEMDLFLDKTDWTRLTRAADW